MKIIAGSAKGRRLKVGKNGKIRPTREKVKEALFSILSSKIEGACFLDLFAGYGNVGMEALSRGAKRVVFVENNFRAVSLIKQNLEITGFLERGFIYSFDVIKSLKLMQQKNESFDLVFMDPPYGSKIKDVILNLLSNSQIIDSDSIVILEHSPKEKIGGYELLSLVDNRKYGDNMLSFFARSV